MADIKDILEASYLPEKDAAERLGQKGYTYDPELSSVENKVFIDKEGKPYIAYRGSATAADWIDNALLALTGKSKKIDERVDLAGKVKEKYGEAPTTYGHSRGGLIAEKAGEKYGGQTITYNKAALPENIFKTIRPEQTDIRTSKDIVSLPSIFQFGGSKETIQSPLISNPVAAHEIMNLGGYAPNERMNPIQSLFGEQRQSLPGLVKFSMPIF